MELYYLDFDFNQTEQGMTKICFVENPATSEELMLFNDIDKNEQILSFSDLNGNIEAKINDNEKRLVTAPIMLAEYPMKRIHPQTGEIVYAKFSADTIEKMMFKYFKDKKIDQISFNHNNEKIEKGMYLVESYILNDNLKSSLYSDLPNGSWLCTFYVEDENLWNKLKKESEKGKINGLSLEGKFQFKKITTDKEKFEEIKNIISSNDSNENKDIKLKKILDNYFI